MHVEKMDLTDALRAEDAQIQKKQELKTKAAHDAATASSSADARLHGESSQVDQSAVPIPLTPRESHRPSPMRVSGRQETTAEQSARTPDARSGNGDKDMEDKMSDPTSPIAQDAMETFATDRIPIKLATGKTMTSARHRERQRRADPRQKLNEMSMSEHQQFHTIALTAMSAVQRFIAISRRPQLRQTAMSSCRSWTSRFYLPSCEELTSPRCTRLSASLNCATSTGLSRATRLT